MSDDLDNPENLCTYCGKSLGSSYWFSYGIPGIKRTYSCERLLCRTRKERDKQIIKFMRKLNKIVNGWIDNE